MPFLSVILPVHDGDQYLSETIESILGQYFGDFELIIVDDGSNDGSREIIENFLKIDQRIVAIHKAHTGLPDSLNVGLSKSSGVWIARADSDDLSKPFRFSEQLSYLRDNSDVVVLGTGFDLIDEHGKFITRREFRSDLNVIKKILESSECFPHSSAIIKADVLKKLGGYNLNYVKAQDWDLWLRASRFGKIKVHPKSLICLREHPKRMSGHNGMSNQIIYSHCATVCYYLNNKTQEKLRSMKEFEEYFATVESLLEQSNVMMAHNIRSDLISSLINKGKWRTLSFKNIFLFIKYKILKTKNRSVLDKSIANKMETSK